MKSKRWMLSDYDYQLPEAHIAEQPLPERDMSKLLVCRKNSLEHRTFKDIYAYLREGDVIVYNNTRVVPARMFGHKVQSRGKIELLWLRDEEPGLWRAILKPARSCKEDMLIQLGDTNELVRVVKCLGDGVFVLKWEGCGDPKEFMQKKGLMPLPPYIVNKRKKINASNVYDESYQCHEDRKRYQTVFSQIDGAIAAPTAGLHFTRETMHALQEKGVIFVPITLHVGVGTFIPLKEELVSENSLEEEFIELQPESVEKINAAREKDAKVLCVGTTTVRALESSVNEKGVLHAHIGWTKLFIQEGYQFKITQMLLTNFHLPRSSLLVLVSALAGRKQILNAYEEAKQQGYRFYSYGDAMLILGDSTD